MLSITLYWGGTVLPMPRVAAHDRYSAEKKLRSLSGIWGCLPAWLPMMAGYLYIADCKVT